MDQGTWLEISLTVDGEIAEAVAEVLARYLPNGVAIESTAVTANMDDSEGHAVGPLKVYGFLRIGDSQPDPADQNLDEIQRKIEQALWYLSRIQPLPAVQYRLIYEADWSEAWKKYYNPILIGKKLAIIPAWLENPYPDRVEIRMNPGMAFGTGTHPTTQLCLEFIEQVVTPGTDVIDIGCGSGILSIGALKLGAVHALAVDIDPDAVRVSRENAALNDVVGTFETGLGSVAEILQNKFMVRQSPVVLANILAPVLVDLLNEGLGELVTPGGSLVLSGIIETQLPEILAAIEKNGLLVGSSKQIQDWVAIRAIRASRV
jgi:ribosomal protein L11 methyltransferase